MLEESAVESLILQCFILQRQVFMKVYEILLIS